MIFAMILTNMYTTVLETVNMLSLTVERRAINSWSV